MQTFLASCTGKTRLEAARRQWDGGCSGELTLPSFPGSEIFAGLKVAALKENPVLSAAENVRKASGMVFALAASTIASLSSGALATAASITQRRSSGMASEAAFAIETAASGPTAIAALTIRSTSAQSGPVFPSQFLTPALIATATACGA